MSPEKNPFEYLESLEQHTVKPGLERISAILKTAGNPHLALKTFVVAGTNGKTSVCSILSEILAASEFSTGLYTSPHLTDVCERIKINGSPVCKAEMEDLINTVREISLSQKLKASYFETVTAAAFICFKRRNVDFAVMEIGMGGRWDAVNTARPLVSVITNISIDHADYLGNTEEKIAAEKAGVVNTGTPLVTAAKGGALRVIEKTCEEKNAPVFISGKQFVCAEKSEESFSYRGLKWNIRGINNKMKSASWKENVCLALACAEMALLKGFSISPRRAKEAVENTAVEARMEYVRKSPPFIIDGAHNPGSAALLAESISRNHPGQKFVFVVAMSANKDHAGFISLIAPLCFRFIFTNSQNFKNEKPENLKRFAPANVETLVLQTPEDAIEKALQSSVPCCVTGSLYFAGEVKKLLAGETGI